MASEEVAPGDGALRTVSIRSAAAGPADAEVVDQAAVGVDGLGPDARRRRHHVGGGRPPGPAGEPRR